MPLYPWQSENTISVRLIGLIDHARRPRPHVYCIKNAEPRARRQKTNRPNLTCKSKSILPYPIFFIHTKKYQRGLNALTDSRAVLIKIWISYEVQTLFNWTWKFHSFIMNSDRVIYLTCFRETNPHSTWPLQRRADKANKWSSQREMEVTPYYRFFLETFVLGTSK